MKANRPTRIATILAATGALGALTAYAPACIAAVAIEPEVRTEVRTLVVDGDTVIHNGQSIDTEVVIAQSANGKREVRVIGAGVPVPPMPPLPPSVPDIGGVVSMAMAEAFTGVAGFAQVKSIKNAPYSAEIISEKVQTLPDGNQIIRKSTSMAYRDSAGRTRQETRDAAGELKSIHINDAVEGTRYHLSPSKKTATKFTHDKELAKRVEEIREKARVMAKDGKPAYIVETGRPGEKIVISRSEDGSEARKEIREEVKVQVVRAGEAAAAAAGASANAYAYKFGDGDIGRAISETMRAGPIGMSFYDSRWSGKSVTKELGSRDFDGVRAEGKSVSYTIPAGEIGNKNAITVTTETWTSPDLQVVVYSKHSDPRSGDTIYRLANVKRGEPAAALFHLPDGYEVKESRMLVAPRVHVQKN